MAPLLVSADVDVDCFFFLFTAFDGFKDGRSLSSVVVPFTSK